MVVQGNIEGDLVMGNKTTLFDQRGQQVGRQINVAGDWKSGHLPTDDDQEQ